MAFNLHIGLLRERLEVRNPSHTVLPGGATSGTYTTAGSLWGFVRSLKGMEYLEARQQVAAATYEVAIRYPAAVSVTTRSRLLWTVAGQTRTLNVTEPPRVDETGRFLLMLCSEREPVHSEAGGS